ncbi:translation initiation factor IF-3 [Candidatus Uhrbacteria bacterium RIFCSPLOWO2_01_FULL_53_9]|uniref:Translation initiation factor IF-3 n=1 Tax=Candidatus Uhrbacteria bacterium RIFCSPLOWO2_01_FULL_53_9 TaxID=1802403 RepID=A0A1F7UYA3_9BACT|nr:MAG: translation initiation factor IF-3 [Candidatus Uhrbacteria bacterium RIFCSPLOWO2_01_FULL_53_9]
MRIHRRRKRGVEAKKPLVQDYPTNKAIRVDEMRVITEEGEDLGVLRRAEALSTATEREKDLVLVSPQANPPVAKLMDYGHFRYQKEKEARKNKAKSRQTEVKAVRLSVRIGKHDMDVRVRQALEFLKRGDKVKGEIVLRGRERAFVDLGKERLQEFANILRDEHAIELNLEQPITLVGNRLTILFGMK